MRRKYCFVCSFFLSPYFAQNWTFINTLWMEDSHVSVSDLKKGRSFFLCFSTPAFSLQKLRLLHLAFFTWQLEADSSKSERVIYIHHLTDTRGAYNHRKALSLEARELHQKNLRHVARDVTSWRKLCFLANLFTASLLRWREMSDETFPEILTLQED